MDQKPWTLTAPSATDLYNQVILNALAAPEPGPYRDVLLTAYCPSLEVTLGEVGFNPNRWLTYLDNYFHGGLLLADSLQAFQSISRFRAGKAEALIDCSNLPGLHTWGKCILALTLNAKLGVTLHARTIDWVPTGLLDLRLAATVAQTLGLPRVTLMVSSLRLTAHKLAPYLVRKKLPFQHLNTPLALEVKKFLNSNHSTLRFAQSRRSATRLAQPKDYQEEGLFFPWVKATANDLACSVDIPGPNFRNFLRRSLGLSNQRSGGTFYAWHSLELPEVEAARRHFGIAAWPLSITQMVERRVGQAPKTRGNE